MPNDCRSILSFMCADNTGILMEIKNYLKSKDRIIDFNNVIPIPSHIFRGNVGSAEEKVYGENTWYHWCPLNWGTKWNAYDIELLNDDEYSLSFKFSTAWSPCIPILEKISECFPSIEFQFTCVDEGGYFAFFIEKEANKQLAITKWTDDEDGRKIIEALKLIK